MRLLSSEQKKEPTHKFIACGCRALSVFALTVLMCSLRSQALEDDLLQGFLSPPNSAKPRGWWHWMNGNITKQGIEQDLLWMNRVGIGGLHNVDVGLNTPQVVDKPLRYMTPAWQDAFRYA